MTTLASKDIGFKQTGRGGMSALQAVVPRSILASGTFFCGKKKILSFRLFQEELVVSYMRKNGHLQLVNCLRKGFPGTVLLGK